MIGIALLQFGDSTSGIGALGINAQAFLIQLVTFLIAFLVLRKFAFKPILKVLRERRELIESGVKLGEKMQQQEAELERKVADTLRTARTQADDILAQADDQARQTVQASEDKAREKAAALVAEAEGRIAQDTARARKKLEAELVGLISEATEAIIEEKVDSQKDAALIDKALKGRAAT